MGGKLIIYKGNPIKLLVDFSAETLKGGREWDGISKVLKEENYHPRILNLAKLSFKKGKDFPTQKPREFTRPALQEVLKEVLKAKMKTC